MTTSPAALALALIGCLFAAFEADAQIIRTTPSATAAPLSSTAVMSPAAPAADAPRQTTAVVESVPCAHDITSMLYCPYAGAAGATVLTREIASITITVRPTKGKSLTYVFSKPIDAIFFDLSAIDRFAMPYYIQKVGFDSAAAMRDRIKKGQRP